VNVQEAPAPLATSSGSAENVEGVLPDHGLREAVDGGAIVVDENVAIPERNYQPASLDLRLGDFAWVLRCSFLPDADSTVEQRAVDLALEDKIWIRDGATLHPGQVYLIPLMEELRLPPQVWGKANAKSSTGRLDVFTRVVTDYNNRFDEIRAGYRGKLYLEVVPRSFPVKVEPTLSLNQLRLAVGDSRISDHELRAIHAATPLLYEGLRPVPAEHLVLSGGLFLSVDLSGGEHEIVGFKAQKNSARLDMSKIGRYAWKDFWEPIYPEKGGRMVLLPDAFYLLLSAEGVCIPPGYAAEMMAYDPTAGELRTHYAGFFDPGFGFDPRDRAHGTRAALEVRARDVPFMLEHGQGICKLAFERMAEPPTRLYGADLGSHYQGQATTLSKHFATETADPHPRQAPRSSPSPATELARPALF